jgi:hypothetical protein
MDNEPPPEPETFAVVTPPPVSRGRSADGRIEIEHHPAPEEL